MAAAAQHVEPQFLPDAADEVVEKDTSLPPPRPRPAFTRASASAPESTPRRPMPRLLFGGSLLVLCLVASGAAVVLFASRVPETRAPAPHAPAPSRAADPTAWIDRFNSPPPSAGGAAAAGPHSAGSVVALAAPNVAHSGRAEMATAAPAVPPTAIEAVYAELIRSFADLKVLIQRMTTIESTVGALSTDIKDVDQRERVLAERLAKLEARGVAQASRPAHPLVHRPQPPRVATRSAEAAPASLTGVTSDHTVSTDNGPPSPTPADLTVLSIDLWGGTPSLAVQDAGAVRFVGQGERLPSGWKLDHVDVPEQRATFVGPRGERVAVGVTGQGAAR